MKRIIIINFITCVLLLTACSLNTSENRNLERYKSSTTIQDIENGAINP